MADFEALRRELLAEIQAYQNQNGSTNDTLVLNDTQMFNPQYDKNQYTRDLVTYYLVGVGGMTVSCIGLVCNMMSLLVLTRSCMKSSTYSYLSALAVCDSLFLICTMILVSKDVNKPSQDHQSWAWSEGLYPYLFPYVHALAFTFQVTSIWLTLSFTVDRYIMICHPFTAEPYCTISRARKVILLISFGSSIFNIPKFFEYHTVVLYIPWQNETRLGCDLTDFGRNKYFKHLYHSGFYITLVCGLPFLAMAILNAFLMHAVHQSRKRGREIAVADKKRNDTTIMLIGVVVVFFICQMPALVSRVIWAGDENQASLTRLELYILNEIGTFLVVLNSSINIVPYYFFGKKFRREFWKLFCRCLLRYKRVSRTLSVTAADYNNSRNYSVCSTFLSKIDKSKNGDVDSANRKFSVAYSLRKESMDAVSSNSIEGRCSLKSALIGYCTPSQKENGVKRSGPVERQETKPSYCDEAL